ncbi:MAG: thiamine pyrophosphate-binding protein [Lachnospiraceae bacterium]|nr:thiamine pyrophosphate-binding protein [Lachnospiraceae bacterium]
MKVRIADYIAELLAGHGIRHVFSVTGGGAMYLNDGLGHHPRLQCIYNHHEQACAMAAESYARIHNRMAAVCVTTGPGGTNAITGVLGGWLDSIPMLILSGQVRYDTTARSTGLNIRAMGDQEFDITRAVGCMTKYAEMVIDPARIRYCLEKAIHLAQSGRPGPCWLDIPLNVQGAYVETEDLAGYDPAEDSAQGPEKIPRVTEEQVALILEKLRTSSRPVLNVGNGIRIAGAAEVLRRVVEKLNIPVVTGWNSIDLIEDEHPLYVGRAGIMGDRPGNWAVQNSDLFLSIGSRLSIRQVGYNYRTWARAAYTIVEDVDQEELKKPDLHVDYPIWADARDLLEALDAAIPEGGLPEREEWNARCRYWKQEFPVVQESHYAQSEPTNVYAFIHKLSSSLAEGDITVVGNGSACVVGSHAYVIKKSQRFVINSAVASMGYDLPAAIGACVAADGRQIICISGDGSIQMNLQELQTIIHHRMPIKIFVINNGGYHSIRQTQMNFFGEPLVGIGADSGDLSFPDLEKLAGAYGYPYERISSNAQLGRIQSVLETEGPALCEVMVDATQKFEPKAASKRMEDGTMVSAPLEDLAPFLPREILERQMYIPLVDE